MESISRGPDPVGVTTDNLPSTHVDAMLSTENSISHSLVGFHTDETSVSQPHTRRAHAHTHKDKREMMHKKYH